MAIRHFRHHLLGTTFRLRTDHRPLQFMSTTKDSWEQRARWIVELEEYSFTVEYIENQHNVVEDALSRLGYDKDYRMGESDVVCQQDDRQVNPIVAFVPQSLTSSVNVLKGE